MAIGTSVSRFINRTLTAFDEGGMLSRHIQGYRRRDVQQTMAGEVATALENRAKLVLEAGTGVGKTFAYLVPALFSGKQVIISTGSKNLQEQLFYKDLPNLLTIFGLDIRVALLKGRSNYLCQRRLVAQMEQSVTHDERLLDDLLKLQQFAQSSRDGDLGNLAGVAEDSPAIAMVASTQETCSGKRCAFYEDCFTRKARERAQQARLIVINHHLFFADRVLKDNGFADLLPDSDAVIFDEAHLLVDIAVNYFGSRLSTGSLMRLLDGIERLAASELGDTVDLRLLPQQCRLKLACWQDLLRDSGCQDFRDLLGDKQQALALGELLDELRRLERLMSCHLGRHEMLDDYAVALPEFILKLDRFIACEDDGSLYTLETGERHLQLCISPIDIAGECGALFNNNTAWVFTSATLQVERSLSFFTRELGLEKSREVLLDSPFDYSQQALLCVPRRLGNPNYHAARLGTAHQGAVKQLTEVCLTLIKAAKGRTFILFTSHRMMSAVAASLQGRCQYPLLVQGQGSKQQLLSKFRRLGEAVLLGTGSFWEGVDVRGKLLSCVIIDKLPFPSPDDSLYRARASRCVLNGGDPFRDISLPQAVIALKQGAGRLIRDEHDRGVLVICDNRLVTRDYGQAFLQSLPPMARTRELEKACRFLEAID